MKKANRMLSVFIILSLFIGVSGIAGAGEAEKININTASEKELTQLDGVGPAKAAEIVKYRETNGPFEKAEDLMNVKGIGVKLFEANKERIMVGLLNTEVSGETKASVKEETSEKSDQKVSEETKGSDKEKLSEEAGQSDKKVSEEKKEVSKKKKKKSSEDKGSSEEE